jgi:hypothetical protein
MTVSELLRTIDFAMPARRISTSERDPSDFTRRRTVFSVYFIPLFTQAPRAVATNWPSLHNVTRTLESPDSKVSWYIPSGISAPFIVMGVGRKNGRTGSFFAGSGKLAASKIIVVRVAALIFISPSVSAANSVSAQAAPFDLSILRAARIKTRLKLACNQIGAQPNLDGSQFGRKSRNLTLTPVRSRPDQGIQTVAWALSGSCGETQFPIGKSKNDKKQECVLLANVRRRVSQLHATRFSGVI